MQNCYIVIPLKAHFCEILYQNNISQKWAFKG